MNKPRMYKTLRTRWEMAEKLRDSGDTAQASDLNQLTIAEALIEILAALEGIEESLASIAGKKAVTNPEKITAASKGK